MSPIHNNFVSSWQLRVLIIGQPHKMGRDQRNNKLHRELSATLMEILVSGETYKFSNHVFSLRMLECLAKLQDTSMSLLYFSPSQHFLLRQP